MIDDIKRMLGAGARTNKYMLEISWDNLDSERLNILCKAASFPEHKLSTVSAAYHGRKVVLRGEHEYPETYDITIYDDANLSLRKFFDQWIIAIDDPLLLTSKIFEGIYLRGSVLDLINNILSKNFGMSVRSGSMPFATTLKIWQLDHNNNKVYGYELEDAYPISLGVVNYGADKSNEVVEYTITFAFSEFFPI